MIRLDTDYFSQPTLDVAKDLLGKELTFNDYKGLITETEAYIGRDDPASHAYRGQTPRTAVMFGPPGVSYVYFIYGMYFCLNIVTEKEGTAAGVLIRGLQLMQPESKNLNGPGKLCKHLGITREHNGIDLTTSHSFYVQDKGLTPGYVATPRIGIKVATERLWRFLITEDFSGMSG